MVVVTEGFWAVYDQEQSLVPLQIVGHLISLSQ